MGEGADLLRVAGGDRRRERPAFGRLPVAEVWAACVAEVVASRGVGLVAPEPDEVVAPVGSAAKSGVWASVLRVRYSHPRDEETIAPVQLTPRSSGGVVNNHYDTDFLVIKVDELAIGGVDEKMMRSIGHVRSIAHHPRLVHQAVDVEGLGRSEVDQRAGADTTQDVEAIGLVEAQHDRVVVIPSNLGRELLESPRRVAHSPLCDSQGPRR